MIESLESVQRKCLEWFIPLGVFWLLFFGFVHMFYGNPNLGLFEFFIAIFSLLFLWVYKKTLNFLLVSRAILVLMGVLFLMLIITGGFKGNGIFWIYAFPLLTFFLREKKAAIKWNILFFLSIVILQIANYLEIIKIAYSYETIFEALAAYLVVSFLAFFFAHALNFLLEDLKEKAIFDPLTGIYNRGFVLAYLEQEIEKMKREENKGLCLVFIDLDDFKKINDMYGHIKGDEILFEISKIFKENFRSSDVVGRFGGDEFVLVINTDNKKIIEEKLRFIKDQIEKKFEKYGLSISYGIVTMPKDTSNLEEALKMADKKMYQMKNSKNNLGTRS